MKTIRWFVMNVVLTTYAIADCVKEQVCGIFVYLCLSILLSCSSDKQAFCSYLELREKVQNLQN